jgi:hypothetical protein
MMVKTQDAETLVVALTPATEVDEVQGLFHLRRKEMGLTALIPGLPVQVKGTMNDNHQLVADTVTFKGSDLKVAEDIQAVLTPTDQQVSANQSNIQADQRQIAANAKHIGTNQQDIQANQKKIATNQADIIATNKRFQGLGEYNVLGEVTVYFGNSKVDVEQQYRPQLLALAQKAMTING